MKSLGNQRGDIIQKSNSNENHQCITYTSSPEIAKVIENWEPRNIYFQDTSNFICTVPN